MKTGLQLYMGHPDTNWKTGTFIKSKFERLREERSSWRAAGRETEIEEEMFGLVKAGEEEMVEYGVLHPKTVDSLSESVGRLSDSLASAPYIEPRHSKVIERCTDLISASARSVSLRYQLPTHGASQDDMIEWLETAVSYLQNSIGELLNKHGYATEQDWKEHPHPSADPEELVDWYAALSERRMDRDAYKRLLEIGQSERRRIGRNGD